MATPSRKGKWWLIPLIIFGCGWTVFSYGKAITRTYHEKRVEKEAKWWLKQAEQNAKPTWIEDDAVSWLRHDGFEHVGTGEGVSKFGQTFDARCNNVL
ncbi:MAG TPA: hypothetical protein VKE72_05445 [Methylocella sp.]|nr:hypothetical protein [Methylocella sp.]